MTTAKRVLYSGRVQGVGFRYSTRQLAADFAVAGYVRNTADGRVELVAEGDPAEVERFGAQLGSLIDHVKALESLPLAELPATAQVIPSRNVARDAIALQEVWRMLARKK